MINDSEFILLALSFKMRIIQVSLLLAFLLTTVVSQDDPDESWSIGRQHRWPRWESNAEVLRSRKRRPGKHRYMPRNRASEQKSQNFIGLMGKRSFEEERIRSNVYKKIKLPFFLDILLLQ
ncbi:unnamed protein product [Arctogadus glacialis]